MDTNMEMKACQEQRNFYSESLKLFLGEEDPTAEFRKKIHEMFGRLIGDMFAEEEGRVVAEGSSVMVLPTSEEIIKKFEDAGLDVSEIEVSTKPNYSNYEGSENPEDADHLSGVTVVVTKKVDNAEIFRGTYPAF